MISITNLEKKYKSRVILKNVSMTIPDQSITFLMGKNGSGKTTFIKCLLGLEKYSGDIKINEKEYSHSTEDLITIYDDSSLYKHLSGYDNICLITGRRLNDIKVFCQYYLDDQLLRKKTKYYSFGEKKKIFLIIVEIVRPKTIIMDEVSSGLDYETLVFLKKRIREWSKSSCILLTGHQFDFYHSIVDSLLVVSNETIKQKDYTNHESLEDIYEQLET